MLNIIEISHLNIPEMDLYARATENQLRRRDDPTKAVFIAESPYIIHMALQNGYLPVSCLIAQNSSDPKIEEILKLIPADIPIYAAPAELLNQLTGFKLTGGILCAMKRPVLPSIESICQKNQRIVLLEEVMNPTNVGAIFRSAAALGMDAVLLTAGCSDPFYRRAARVSRGTVFQIPWTYLKPGDFWPEILKSYGFTTLSLALKSDTLTLSDPILKTFSRIVLALGSEGYGLSEKSISASDYTIKIPMKNGVDSLNVAAASAVAFYQLGLNTEQS